VEQFAGRWFLAIAGVFLLVRLLPFLSRPGQPLGYDSGIYFQSYRLFGDAPPGLPSFADGSFHQLEANVLRFLSDFLLLSGLNPDDLVFALLLAVQMFLLFAVWLFARHFFWAGSRRLGVITAGAIGGSVSGLLVRLSQAGFWHGDDPDRARALGSALVVGCAVGWLRR
jgi:hypothetical protein